MTHQQPASAVDFDVFAADYDDILDQALAFSGERKAFFARGRVRWLDGHLQRRGRSVRSVMDFGCGSGSTCALLLDALRAESVIGVDVSSQQLELARRRCPSPRVRFLSRHAYEPRGELELVYCNGVFHHIPIEQRSEALDYIYRALEPNGLFAFWENNPWNPGTRYVMSRIPFDRDAVTISAPSARAELRAAGFEVLRTDFLFIFPRILSSWRRLEPLVCRVPLGAQYQILCRKPATHRRV
ncbi:MAG: class I SAM-dependent methyltransferase [Planctomycetota bacterium]